MDNQRKRKYWLHRISYEWDVSSWLLKHGILTIGWSDLSNTSIVSSIRSHTDTAAFERIMASAGQKENRSRWNLWHFCNFNIGDIVLVPLYNSEFSLYEIVGSPMPITKLPRFNEQIVIENGNQILIDDDGYFKRALSGKRVDLGFAVSVKPLRENLSRYEFADNALTARMKMRQANGDISDLEQNILNVLKADSPINLYVSIIKQLSDQLLAAIKEQLTPDKFENLIKWYFQKVGATKSYINAKNKSGKSEGADADIIAEFEQMRVIIYVQAKLHDNITSQWAVEQIMKYKDQFDAQYEDYTTIPWVISTAEKFSDEAITLAQENHVRLLSGHEFSRLLLDVGITDINEAFD